MNKLKAGYSDKFNRGFCYANKHLTDNTKSVVELEREADNAFDYDDFDRGINEAIRQHNTA